MTRRRTDRELVKGWVVVLTVAVISIAMGCANAQHEQAPETDNAPMHNTRNKGPWPPTLLLTLQKLNGNAEPPHEHLCSLVSESPVEYREITSLGDFVYCRIVENGANWDMEIYSFQSDCMGYRTLRSTGLFENFYGYHQGQLDQSTLAITSEFKSRPVGAGAGERKMDAELVNAAEDRPARTVKLKRPNQMDLTEVLDEIVADREYAKTITDLDGNIIESWRLVNLTPDAAKPVWDLSIYTARRRGRPRLERYLLRRDPSVDKAEPTGIYATHEWYFDPGIPERHRRLVTTAEVE